LALQSTLGAVMLTFLLDVGFSGVLDAERQSR
jgi:hypothetical protein